MTVGKIIESIYLRVSGGRPSPDVSVLRVDIKAALPAAVNYAITQNYWQTLQAEGDSEIPGTFISEYLDVPIQQDAKNRDYIQMPQKIVPLGSNRGLRYISDDCGNNYKPMPQGGTSGFSCYWGKVMKGKSLYSLVGDKAYIINKPDMVEKLNVGALTNVESLSDSDEAPIPAGYEPQVLDILAAFFRDQRFTPKDYIINGRDLPV